MLKALKRKRHPRSLVSDGFILQLKCSKEGAALDVHRVSFLLHKIVRLTLHCFHLLVVEICEEGYSFSNLVDDLSTLQLWKSFTQGLQICNVEAEDIGTHSAPGHVFSPVGDFNCIFPL
ncbi:hypothetical protein FOPG_09106 [Fusarium oxysporum f. sp. conglutinans race 2 54008]|uniref:Uncharacterized protein n=1 Tax=Fusarium oxysporum f. sp. conglutinans race 2 54008 TaxID=1089457 RepID=X0ISU4_FUSOX|nr:hypothetical protein FOPG_09106 [Fusarium oxysporum f. sp. conglutinans race 2 54008]